MITTSKPTAGQMPIRQQQAPAATPIQPEEPGLLDTFQGIIAQEAMGRTATAAGKYGEEQAGNLFSKIPSMFNMAPAVTAPQAAGMAQMAAPLAAMPGATGAASMGLAPGAAQAVLGSSQAAAPLVAQAAGTGGLATGATAAGTGGMMAGLGAAVPYVGMGLLAGKALGLFNDGTSGACPNCGKMGCKCGTHSVKKYQDGTDMAGFSLEEIFRDAASGGVQPDEVMPEYQESYRAWLQQNAPKVLEINMNNGGYSYNRMKSPLA